MKDFLKKINKYLPFMAGVFFLFMMLYNITHSSLWGDEWVEYSISQMGILNREMYHNIIDTFQPPLYNLLMHFWLLINNSVLWFRLFNVIPGIISGIALFLSIKSISNEKTAALSLIALGATYQWIYCIQECSEYALMLMFVFLALYFYTELRKEYSLKCEIGLILSCVFAIYSQYGAFFVAAPLLIMHLINIIKAHIKKATIRTMIFYIVSMLVFAAPLWFLFARRQILAQEIAENATINTDYKMWFSFPLVFGRIFAYFINLTKTSVLNMLVTFVGVLLFGALLVLLFQKDTKDIVKDLIFIMLVAYSMFFVLVTLKVYAMVHPNQSAGYYSRYAFFFIPLFFVLVPNVVSIIISKLNRISVKKVLVLIVSCFLIIIFVVPYPSLLFNWEKNYDSEFAEIWINNAGFAETTVLCGGECKTGFEYYTKPYGCDITGEVITSNELDMDNLPESFWVWRSNWADDAWQIAVKTAKDAGYDVKIFADHGYSGQLAYCKKHG